MTFRRSCCLTNSNEPHSPGCKKARKREMPLPPETRVARACDLGPFRAEAELVLTANGLPAASCRLAVQGRLGRQALGGDFAESIVQALNAWIASPVANDDSSLDGLILSALVECFGGCFEDGPGGPATEKDARLLRRALESRAVRIVPASASMPVALPRSEGIDERIESAFCGGNLTGHAVRQTLGNWGLEVVESADWDPPVCRLQFPDGSVPGNAREAAEGWHRIAEERLAEIRALTAAVAGINESERAHTEKFGLYGASCDELRPDPNAGSFVDHDEKLGAGCDDVAVEPPTPTEPPVECAAMEVSQDAARDPLGAVTQAMTSDAPARPDVATEPQGEDELPDPRRMPFEPQARVRSLDNPWLGALIVAAQEYGSNEEGWSVTAIPVGGRTAIKFAAESLEPVDTGRQLVMCLNGDMIDMARFAEELAQQTIDRTLQAFVMKERAGRPLEGSAGGFAGQD
jgi:hypothetical protein